MELADNEVLDNKQPGLFKRIVKTFGTKEGQILYHGSSFLTWLQAFPAGTLFGVSTGLTASMLKTKVLLVLSSTWSKVVSFTSALWATINLT